MTTELMQEFRHIGETRGCADRHHDLIHELSRQLDAIWRYDQYIANAEGYLQIQVFWINLKDRVLQDVRRMKELLSEELRQNNF